MVRRAERFVRIDENGAGAVGNALAIVAAVHDEAAGRHRRQRGLRDRHPIEFGKVFQVVRRQPRPDSCCKLRRGGLRFRARLPVGFDAPCVRAIFEQRHGVGRFRFAEGPFNGLRDGVIGRAHGELGAGHFNVRMCEDAGVR